MTCPEDDDDGKNDVPNKVVKGSKGFQSGIQTVLSPDLSPASATMPLDGKRASIGSRPALHRSVSSPQLTTLPPPALLMPPSFTKPAKKKSFFRKKTPQVRRRARTQPYEAPYDFPVPDAP
ncbi:hypothetical protein AX17_000270 [Amanita inopinata Kibby_2008]|nr:hypothetical protein AX17_000270 [Amanita inopinata Kibby_2008]